MIFGVYGATRAVELVNINVSEVVERGNIFIINIPNTKTNVDRQFTIEHDYIAYVRKYRDLRPPNVTTARFFINYQKGKCTKQPIGRNKFLNAAKTVATFLHLKDPQLYTGHSFRRTSATLLANAGADILTLKRHGGWRSSTAAEGYVQDSIGNKRKIGALINDQVKVRRTVASTATSTVTSGALERSDIEPDELFESTEPDDLLGSTEQVAMSTINHTTNSAGAYLSCSQSILNVVRNECSQLVVTSNTVPSTTVAPLQPLKQNNTEPFQFNNCTVNIHFHK